MEETAPATRRGRFIVSIVLLTLRVRELRHAERDEYKMSAFRMIDQFLEPAGQFGRKALTPRGIDQTHV